jgi:AraC family transcriptional regulator
MLMNSLATRVASPKLFSRDVPRPPQAGVLIPLDRRAGFGTTRGAPSNGVRSDLRDRPGAGMTGPAVDISPADIVKRRSVAWDGMTVEIVQATRREKIECRFDAPVHLLAVCEQGMRSDGETFVEGLPRSTLRDLKKKLTFVPAGHEYREWQEPRILSRVVYFYFDPAKMPVLSETGFTNFSPRLHFEDTALWNTALKLRTLIESAGADNRLYLEALGVVLAHELARLNPGMPRIEAPIRGGLAAWQQRVVTTYIEEHLPEQISLATLAGLVRLSPYYFCRAFKQSIGVPPHRYHTIRRIERAKALLAKPAPSVTDIGLTVGFSETSSFTAAFRKATGFTPTGFHRSLD